MAIGRRQLPYAVNSASAVAGWLQSTVSRDQQFTGEFWVNV
jgi:hypothetical protein